MSYKTLGIDIVFWIVIVIAFVTSIASITAYHLYDRKLMAENVKIAVEKGIDPLTVRCTYAPSTDSICVALAAAQSRK